MMDLPEPTAYKGVHRIASDSPWLAADDLPSDKDTIVTIEAVHLRRDVTMDAGRKKDVALSLRFVGKKRELMLNATNRKTLSMLSGSNKCEAWFGMTIALFVQQGVRRPDKTKGPAIRIRPKQVKDGVAVDTTPEPESPGGDLPDIPEDMKEVMQ